MTSTKQPRSHLLVALMIPLCVLFSWIGLGLHACGRDDVCDAMCTDAAWDSGQWNPNTSACECEMEPVRRSLRSKVTAP